MHAAKDDIFGVRLAGQARQLQRVAGQIGVLVDVRPLVVMAEQNRAITQFFSGSADAFLTDSIGKLAVFFEISHDSSCLKLFRPD